MLSTVVTAAARSHSAADWSSSSGLLAGSSRQALPVRSAMNGSLVDPNWAGFPSEVYLFAAFVYFCFCFSMSRYSKYLEIELNKGTRR